MGYAWVPIELAADGVDARGRVARVAEMAATVTALPFLDPNKDVPKG